MAGKSNKPDNHTETRTADRDEAPRRNRAAGAFRSARERTVSAYEAARERTTDATRQATAQMAIYPVGAVIAGLAAGALLGAVLPRTRRESEWFGTTGRRLASAARDAAQKGVDAGRERIDQVTGKVVNKVGSAVMEAVGGKD